MSATLKHIYTLKKLIWGLSQITLAHQGVAKMLREGRGLTDAKHSLDQFPMIFDSFWPFPVNHSPFSVKGLLETYAT